MSTGSYVDVQRARVGTEAQVWHLEPGVRRARARLVLLLVALGVGLSLVGGWRGSGGLFLQGALLVALTADGSQGQGWVRPGRTDVLLSVLPVGRRAVAAARWRVVPLITLAVGLGVVLGVAVVAWWRPQALPDLAYGAWLALLVLVVSLAVRERCAASRLGRTASIFTVLGVGMTVAFGCLAVFGGVFGGTEYVLGSAPELALAAGLAVAVLLLVVWPLRRATLAAYARKDLA